MAFSWLVCVVWWWYDSCFAARVDLRVLAILDMCQMNKHIMCLDAPFLQWWYGMVVWWYGTIPMVYMVWRY